ncbi:hypothetical protein UFOVP129_81 [uncultured Caudovirales phage]|uniref:Uncharacterized protein n=1 Tax=uncultured Caudovirales phage TaxID=2100421 RepID=A0A6J5LEQ0_9CAUD|nr:hypothetical protein UFOVP129_81 [uncultured Caudovirales phage]
MKKVTVKKGALVANTDKQLLKKGIIAFQLVVFTINFYGKEIIDTLDTKIMKDGTQIVIDGNGYIKAGYQL